MPILPAYGRTLQRTDTPIWGQGPNRSRSTSSDEGNEPMTTITTSRVQWDEPAGCTTPRGWLLSGGMCVGFYLDYGPGNYRSPHSQVLNTINGPREVVFCQPGRLCPACQPGNILAVRYPGGPGTPNESRYFETIAEAREWIETGITR